MRDFSLALFGSILRKDFDKYSDKDLLIVADSYKSLNGIKNKFNDYDWSISYYTYSKLEYLSKKGSLFIKHLKVESETIIDKDNKLNNILMHYDVKDSYHDEFMKSIHYFDIIKNIPNSIYGYSWFCDCFYVGLRNTLIFQNATNKVFIFSFIKLLQHLVDQGKINQLEFDLLKELRVVKYNYRGQFNDIVPSKEYIKKIIHIGEKLIPNFSSKFIPINSFQEYIKEDILSLNYDPYQRLRLIEGYYCSQQLIIPVLKNIISNPQLYGCKLKDNKYTLSLIDLMIDKSPEKNLCLQKY